MKTWLVKTYPITLIISIVLFVLVTPPTKTISDALSYAIACIGVVIFVLGIIGLTLRLKRREDNTNG